MTNQVSILAMIEQEDRMAASLGFPDPARDALDAIIDKIDECLPKIHAKAKEAKNSGLTRTPTGGFSPKNVRQARAEFEAMTEDSLLTESHEDIALKESEESEKPPSSRFFRRRR
jgi:hypothetical protein